MKIISIIGIALLKLNIAMMIRSLLHYIIISMDYRLIPQSQSNRLLVVFIPCPVISDRILICVGNRHPETWAICFCGPRLNHLTRHRQRKWA